MSPTDALFDAINRGDLPAARDAVNRGANLDARNLLALTPMELSVDLARNDISFFLLSMRGGDAGPARDSERRTNGAPAAAVQAPRRQRAAAPEQPPREREARTVAAPRLYSGNGGSPIPSAGFVGFDGGRSTH